MIAYLFAAFSTIFIESIVGFLLLRKYRIGNVLKVIIGANLITNPLVNFLIFLFYFISISQLGPPNFLYFHYSIIVLLLEVVVIIFESIIIYKYLGTSIKKAVVTSIIMNSASFILGL